LSCLVFLSGSNRLRGATEAGVAEPNAPTFALASRKINSSRPDTIPTADRLTLILDMRARSAALHRQAPTANPPHCLRCPAQTLFTALHEQLGLKLESAKGLFVVDYVECPDED